MKPHVTVLMTVYNGLPYLREAIESVLSQNFTDFEFVIVDDASTDLSVQTVESYGDSRIRLIRNDSNLGQNASLNKGLTAARGDWIVRLDQDDVCLPERIQRQVDFLSRNPEVAVAGTWAYSIDERSRKQTVWQWRVPDFGTLAGLFLVGRCALLHPSVAYRLQPILSLGGYPNDYGIASDYALWIDLILNGQRAAVMPEQLIMYRVHKNRQSASKAHKHWEDTVRAHEKLVSALSRRPDVAMMASVLRIESTVWKQARTHKEIASVLESIEDLLNHAPEVLPLRSGEWEIMRRTVYRWLGPGVKLGARLKFAPWPIFYATVFAFSPLLIPGVRPMATRLLEVVRSVRMLGRRRTINHF
jgi:hypothetical protein